MVKDQKWRQKSGYTVKSVLRPSGELAYIQTRKYKKNPFAMLGSIGTLPIKTIIAVRLTVVGQQMIDGTYVYNPMFPLDHAVGVSETNILKLLREWLYKPLVEYITNYINVDVPSDTNTLRETMIKSMGSRWGESKTAQISNRFPFKIAISTGDLDYPGYVTKMPTLIRIGKNKYMGLRHPPERFPGDTRNDPEARQYWWEHVVRNGRNYAQIMFRKFYTTFFRRYLFRYKKEGIIPKSYNGRHIFKAGTQ